MTYFTQTLRLQLSPNIQLQAVLPGATRTEIWDRSGAAAAPRVLDPNMLMELDDLVDSALAGFFQGELITIPILPDPADFAAYDAARARLLPNLSRNRSAERLQDGHPRLGTVPSGATCPASPASTLSDPRGAYPGVSGGSGRRTNAAPGRLPARPRRGRHDQPFRTWTSSFCEGNRPRTASS